MTIIIYTFRNWSQQADNRSDCLGTFIYKLLMSHVQNFIQAEFSTESDIAAKTKPKVSFQVCVSHDLEQ